MVSKKEISTLLQGVVTEFGKRNIENAKALLEKVLNKDRRNPQALFFEGIIYREENKFDKAEYSFKRSLSVAPKQYNVLVELSSIQLDLKRYEDAKKTAEKALKLEPNGVDAYVFKANALMKLEQHKAALEVANKAYSIDAEHDLVLWLIAYLNYKLDDFEVAYEFADKALNINPELKILRVVKADYLRTEKKQMSASIKLIEEELKLDPKSLLAYWSLGVCLSEVGRNVEAINYLRKQLKLSPQVKKTYHSLMTFMQYSPETEIADILHESKAFYRHFFDPEVAGAKVFPVDQYDFSNWNFDPKKKVLKVGFISAEFINHVMLSWLHGLFENLAAKDCEIYCYSNVKPDNTLSEWQKGVTGWKNIVGFSDKEAADAIFEDEIDVLIEVSGHLFNNSLFALARKPCPLQITWLGQSGPMGLPQIDYMITDKNFVPPEFDKYYNEKIYRMPNYYAARPPMSYEIELKPAPCIENGYVTFGSFNTYIKINEVVLDTWAKILYKVPDSKLIIKSNNFVDAELLGSTRRFFNERNLGPDRVILEESSPTVEYLASYNRVDISLDPFPLGGGTTTHDALWMSTPLISKVGEHASHRVGTILKYIDLEDLMADSIEEYIEIAANLANNKERIIMHKQSLREIYINSPLCDTETFYAEFSQALREMWANHCHQS